MGSGKGTCHGVAVLCIPPKNLDTPSVCVCVCVCVVYFFLLSFQCRSFFCDNLTKTIRILILYETQWSTTYGYFD